MADCEIGRVSPFIETLHATCDNEILFIVCPGIYQMAEISPVRSEKTVIYCESEKKLEMKFNLSERVRSKGPVLVPFHSIPFEDEGSLLILIYSCDGFLNPFHCVCPCVSLRDRDFLLGPFLQANLPRNRDEARTRRMNNVMCLMRSIPWLTDSHISSWALK